MSTGPTVVVESRSFGAACRAAPEQRINPSKALFKFTQYSFLVCPDVARNNKNKGDSLLHVPRTNSAPIVRGGGTETQCRRRSLHRERQWGGTKLHGNPARRSASASNVGGAS